MAPAVAGAAYLKLLLFYVFFYSGRNDLMAIELFRNLQGNHEEEKLDIIYYPIHNDVFAATKDCLKPPT